MRTVLATSHTPTLDSGRARRTYGIARALAALGPVEMVYGAFGAAEPDPAYFGVENLTLHRVERPGPLERAPGYLRARLRRIPDDFARGIWPGIARACERLLAVDPESRLVADGPVVAAGLLGLAVSHRSVYSAHNLESSFRHRLDETDMSPAALRRFERLLLDRYAEAWMVSAVDMAGAAELAPGATVRLVPNVVDVAAIEPIPPRTSQRTVLFVADHTYEPNRGAARFLIEEAMPALWQTAPDARLVLAGKESDRVASTDSRVEPSGFVPDLRDLYDAAGCVAVPLLEGGGSPLKFVEALAFRAPVVATPLAAAGLEARGGEHYLEADPDGGAFAAALLEGLDPERGNPVAAAGRSLAEAEYSIEALERRLAP